MLSADARRSVARAYEAGMPVKVIAFEHGIGSTSVSDIARKEGVELRRPHGQPKPRMVDENAVLRLYRSGLDTFSIAARLMTTQAVAANALARGRDRERGQ